jgi:hypothetical protein
MLHRTWYKPHGHIVFEGLQRHLVQMAVQTSETR